LGVGGVKSAVTRCVYFVALSVFATNFAQAQTSPENTQKAITGLSELKLLVDGLDADSQKCGITESLIRDAFMFPVSSSRLNIVSKASYAGPVFYIRVTTLDPRNSSQCVTSLEAEVINFQLVKLDYKDDEPSWVTVKLWDDIWVTSSNRADHPQKIQHAVENATKKFVTIWNIANKDFRSPRQH
jgi:hypothetical protein